VNARSGQVVPTPTAVRERKAFAAGMADATSHRAR
jgi:hypothetical protein